MTDLILVSITLKGLNGFGLPSVFDDDPQYASGESSQHKDGQHPLQAPQQICVLEGSNWQLLQIS
jgi:hypothetical protein